MASSSKNEHFNFITDNEALAIEIELQNGNKVILATIYCPNGNLSLRRLRSDLLNPKIWKPKISSFVIKSHNFSET